ncbi:MAG: WD40 repeat domain-containing protein [Aggregatilineales bacterium]
MKWRYLSLLVVLLVTILFSAYAQDDVTPTPRPIFMTNTPQPRFVAQYQVDYDIYITPYLNWSPDGSYLLIGGYSNEYQGNRFQLLEATTGTYLRDLEARPIWFDDEHYWLFVREETHRRLGTLYFVRAGTGEILYTLENVHGNLTLNPERTQFSMGYILGGRIYDTQTGALLRQTDSQVRWSPDGAYTVNEAGDTIYVASAETGNFLYQLAGHQLSPSNTWSPDSARLIVEPLGEWGYTLNPIRIWTFPDTLSEVIYNTNFGQIWSPDSTRIATVMDALKLRIWDATTGELLETFNDHKYPTLVTEWTQDGRYILLNYGDYRYFGHDYVVYDVERGEMVLDTFQDLGSQYRINGSSLEILETYPGYRQYDLNTGEIIEERRFGNVGFIRFHANWQWGATIFFNGSIPDSLIGVYDISQNRLFQTIETPFDEVFNLVWHPTQNILAVTGLTNEVIVYRLEE